jgi:hypothetical protein
MKKIVLSLLGAATMALSANAMALDTTVPYFAFLSRGLAPIPVGVLTFEFFGDIPLTACQYVAEWDDLVPALPLSGQIFVDEAKTQANFSCVENSLLPVPSFLALDGTFPSFGFDYFQQLRQVFLLEVGESLNHDNEGLIQFTGATPIVYGFDFHP